MYAHALQKNVNKSYKPTATVRTQLHPFPLLHHSGVCALRHRWAEEKPSGRGRRRRTALHMGCAARIQSVAWLGLGQSTLWRRSAMRALGSGLVIAIAAHHRT